MELTVIQALEYPELQIALLANINSILIGANIMSDTFQLNLT
jgi:hypothetical protein